MDAEARPAAGPCDSFDCKAMRELNTNVRRGFLPYIQDRALHASSSIF
jgi:hypothetical protein